MKHKFVFLLLLFSSTFYAQSLDNLDSKFGINKFKLESNYTNYKKDLKFLKESEEKGVKQYLYTGSDITDLFNVPIAEIILEFYNNELYQIIYDFEELDFDIHTMMQSKLIQLFGNEFSNGGEKGRFVYSTWQTDKVHLQHIIFLSESLVEDRSSIVIFSMKLKQQIIDDQF